MRVLIVSCLLMAVVPAPRAAQPRSYGVTVTAEKGVDFTGFKTYSWTAGRPSSIKTIDAQIVAAVDRELDALGMTKVDTGSPDVLVTYSSLSRTDVDTKAKPDEKGMRPEFAVGMLTVALLDPSARRPLLQLRADKPIDTDTAGLAAAIDAAVAEMFAKYPTRSQ
jgi:hypothetical protein